MRIMLFGGSGQVGQEIQILCRQKNVECFSFDSSVDITSKQDLNDVFSKYQEIDFVVNCAAYTAVDKAEDEVDKAYAINSTGVENLAVFCKQQNIPIIHLSTDFVFSGAKDGPYTEQDTPEPLGVYGNSKYEGEKILQKTWEKHLILRVSWVFGKYGNNFVKTISRLASEREVLNVVGDQRGCPTAAEDIARVVIELAGKIKSGNERWGIYHYAGCPATTWFDFASQIVDLWKEKNPHAVKAQKINKVKSEEYVTRAKRPKNSELSTDKIKSDYGIKQHEWRTYLRQNFYHNPL